MRKLFDNPDWTEASLQDIWAVIKDIAINEFKLDFYEPYFEVVTFEDMLHIYTTSFPVMYNHWSFGKNYEELYRQYKNNQTSIAYEVIFNTNPALCYLLENNSSVMQALVMAHAAVGHSAFFKMNSFIRENTNANTILPYLKNMRTYVQECEAKYGVERVEKILDVCASMALYSVDRAEKPVYTSKQIQEKKNRRDEALEKDFNILVEDLNTRDAEDSIPKERAQEENILKFIAKYSPSLKTWERDLINMFCKVEQYFYPQRLTKMMNEGFASFWHYQLMNRLSELGHLKEGDYLEFMHSHTSVLCQHGMEDKHYSGTLNPYKIGFEMFSEIKRICENPTEEDREYFPQLIGKNWIDEVNYAAINFRDPSFVLQYLSPKLVRDFKFLTLKSKSEDDYVEITATHDTEDFKAVRSTLEAHYDFYTRLPYITVEGAALKSSRALFINVTERKNREVDGDSLAQTLDLLKTIWPYPIKVKYTNFFGNVAEITL